MSSPTGSEPEWTSTPARCWRRRAPSSLPPLTTSAVRCRHAVLNGGLQQTPFPEMHGPIALQAHFKADCLSVLGTVIPATKSWQSTCSQVTPAAATLC